jgi:hypothetical protein
MVMVIQGNRFAQNRKTEEFEIEEEEKGCQ